MNCISIPNVTEYIGKKINISEAVELGDLSSKKLIATNRKNINEEIVYGGYFFMNIVAIIIGTLVHMEKPRLSVSIKNITQENIKIKYFMNRNTWHHSVRHHMLDHRLHQPYYNISLKVQNIMEKQQVKK